MVPDTTFDAAPKITPSASRGKCGPVGPLPNLDRPPVIANAFDNSSTIRRGFDKGTIFDNHIQEVELQLKPGDRICAYTDGVNEAMDPQSEEFGDERFYNLVKQHARLSSKDFVNAIVAEVEAHRAGGEQSDDITITTLAVMK